MGGRIMLASPYAAFVLAVGTYLQFVAPTVRGDSAKYAIAAPPRYNWRASGVDIITDRTAVADGYADEYFIGVDGYEASVDCWGATEDDCVAMRIALINAIRDTVKGRNYKIGKSDFDEPNAVEELGFHLLVPVTVYLLCPEVDVATVAAAAPADGQFPNASAQVTASKDGQADLETFGFDTTGALPTDGTIVAGEEEP